MFTKLQRYTYSLLQIRKSQTLEDEMEKGCIRDLIYFGMEKYRPNSSSLTIFQDGEQLLSVPSEAQLIEPELSKQQAGLK